MKNILITGAAGFIGHQLWAELKKKNGIKIYGVDDLSSKPVIKPPKDLIVKSVSNLNTSFLKKNNIHTIVHLAARKNVDTSFYKLNDSVENYKNAFSLLNSAYEANVKNFYNASSCEIFGYKKKFLKENDSFVPHSPYAVSKVAIEYLIDTFLMRQKKMKICSLIFFNTYGPTEGTDAVIPKFVKHAIKNKKIYIEGRGDQSRDFTFIDDTINVLTKIIFSSKNFRKINIGSKKTYSVNDIVSLLKKKNISFDVQKKKSRPNEIKTFCADNSLIKKSYNFKKKTNLNNGIDKIIDFYKKND